MKGKYDGSEYESDESIHNAEDNGVDYHENDKTKIKKIIKKNKTNKDKTIVDKRLKNELSNIKKIN